jgi:RHS repeat-associated protein
MGVGSTSYEYDAWGRLSQTVNANGTTETRGYDGLGRLTSLKTFAPDITPATLADNPVLSSFQNGYRADGKRTSTSETIGSLNNFTVWTYDELGRLTAERLDSSDDSLDRETAWTFDGVGNRLTEAVDLALDGDVDKETSFTYDQNDRLLSEAITFTTGPVVEIETTAYTYQGTQQTGKQTSKAGLLQSETTYQWDATNRLAQVTVTHGANTLSVTRFTYDTRGERIAVEAAGSKTEYLLDRQNATGYSQTVVETTTDTSTVSRLKEVRYVVGHDQHSQTSITYTNGVTGIPESLFFTADARTSNRLLTDAIGSIVEAYVYAAYGDLLASFNAQNAPGVWQTAQGISLNTALARTSYLYAGEAFDRSTGLSNNRARWYGTGNGRFLGLDEYSGNQWDPQSFNKYGYVHGNPVNGVDPSGMFFSAVGMLGSIGIQNSIASSKMAIDVSILGKAENFADAVTQRKSIGDLMADLNTAFLDDATGGIYSLALSSFEFAQDSLALFSDANLSLKDKVFTFGLNGLAIAGTAVVIILPWRTGKSPQLKKPLKNWKSTNTGITGTNSELLRKSLGVIDGTGTHAHHIVPSTHARADRARKLLDKYQIDINSADNGVPLSKSEHYGQLLHSDRSIERVTDQLRAAAEGKPWAQARQDVIDKLGEIALIIKNGGTP